MLRYPESAGGDILEASLGKIWFYAGETDPTDGLICDGRLIKYTEYPELTEFLNTLMQTGSPRKDINLPDCRGMFLRGYGGLSDKIARVQNDAIKKFTGWFRVTVQHQDKDYNKFGGCFRLKNVIWRGDNGEGGYRETYDYEFDPSINTNTAEETRPKNMAFNIVIGTGRIKEKKVSGILSYFYLLFKNIFKFGGELCLECQKVQEETSYKLDLGSYHSIMEQ